MAKNELKDKKRQTLGRIIRKGGEIWPIKNGARSTVFVSNRQAIKECLVVLLRTLALHMEGSLHLRRARRMLDSVGCIVST
ncbi:hypothetical protein DFP78_11512 [Photobacterium lutimaris]|nr:hypothetical protein DFP78_11512 [Photobacterium lutimaris]